MQAMVGSSFSWNLPCFVQKKRIYTELKISGLADGDNSEIFFLFIHQCEVVLMRVQHMF